MCSNDLGRNDKCHCGSGKKYKNCCKDMDDMFDRLRREHDRKQEEVMEFFNNVTKEINFHYSSKDNFQPLRSHFVLLFTWIDVLARYWCHYQHTQEPEKCSNPKALAKKWTERFLFNDENDTYLDCYTLGELNGERLYRLRCSLVHFMGVGKPIDGHTFALVPDQAPDHYSKLIKEKVEKSGNTVSMLSPNSLHDAVRDGAALMLNEMKKGIEKGNEDKQTAIDHMKGIKSIHQKVEEEGAILAERDVLDDFISNK